MMRRVAACLFVFAALALAQDEIRSSGVGRPDAVIFMDVDKRLTENERNNSEESADININKTVISNENLSNTTQISDVADNSSSNVYNSSTTFTTHINYSFVMAQPLDLREINITRDNFKDVNETAEAENDARIRSRIESDDGRFQLDNSSEEVGIVRSTVVSPIAEVTTDNPSSGGNSEDVSTNTDGKDEKTGWSNDVTQYSDDYMTTIIFTNLYSPGEDSVADSAGDGDVPPSGKNGRDESSAVREVDDSDYDTRQGQTDGEGTDPKSTSESESPRNSPILFNNGHIGSGAVFEMKTNSDNMNSRRGSGFVENTETVNDRIVISRVSFPPIDISNDTDNIGNLNDGVDVNEKTDDVGSGSNGDLSAGTTEGAVVAAATSRPSPVLPIRLLPQRKDIKTLIEEKRRMSSQNTFRRSPLSRINSTRLNREIMKIPPRDNSDKLTTSLKNQPVTIGSKGSTEAVPDIYELERSARRSWGGCARECDSTVPMTCHYELTLEWFYSMSKACYSCPRNITDCFRPHCIPTDGVKRTIAVISRSLPGPLIQVCEGDVIVAKVRNLMMESTTTVHWHGQHQMLTPYMDGVPSVTQCPIEPRAAFTYSFTATQPGTHFYHSHSGVQRGDGAFGGLIIRRPQSKERHKWTYDHDLPEHTVIILDWTHQLGLDTFTHHHQAGGGNKPDTILVNGRGIQANRALPPASFTVTKGMRYRFRLINAGFLNCPIRLSIDDHRLTIIASDGNDIQPYLVDWLVTYAGERWDFVVEANGDVSNYWMRFIGLMDCDERFKSAHQGAVLHYNGSSNTLPTAPLDYNTTTSTPRLERQPKVLNALNAGMSDGATLVHQLSGLARAQPWLSTRQPDKKIVLAYDFNPVDNDLFHKKNLYGFSQVLDVSEKIYTPQLNHISLKLPPFPLLSQSYMLTPDMLCTNMNQETCKKDFCECTNIIDIALGSVVEIIFIDQGFVYDANHPFHLHGHSFYVVGMDRLGRNVTSERILELDGAGLLDRNLGDPPLKDTVTVPDGGYTIIRFLANNPGYWLLHCHIDFHVEVGMAVVLHIGETQDIPPAPPGFPACGDFDPDQSSSTGDSGLDDTADNSIEEGVVSLLDSIVTTSFGSRWKYNMSSSVTVMSPSFYTTVCALAVGFLLTT